MSVKLLVIAIIEFKRYPSTFCLMQGRCFICSNVKIVLTSKLESQPLSELLAKRPYVFISIQNIVLLLLMHQTYHYYIRNVSSVNVLSNSVQMQS